MAQAYNIGDLVRLQGTLTDSNDAALDPLALTVKVKEPDETITTLTYPATVTKSATGIYYANFTPTQSGRHYVNFTSTGTGQAADELHFIVRTSAFE